MYKYIYIYSYPYSYTQHPRRCTSVDLGPESDSVAVGICVDFLAEESHLHSFILSNDILPTYDVHICYVFINFLFS